MEGEKSGKAPQGREIFAEVTEEGWLSLGGSFRYSVSGRQSAIGPQSPAHSC